MMVQTFIWTGTDVTSHNKRYLMSVFENFEIFAVS